MCFYIFVVKSPRQQTFIHLQHLSYSDFGFGKLKNILVAYDSCSNIYSLLHFPKAQCLVGMITKCLCHYVNEYMNIKTKAKLEGATFHNFFL